MKATLILIIGFVFGAGAVFGYQESKDWEPVPIGGAYIKGDVGGEGCSTFIASTITQTKRDDSGMVYLMLRNLSCSDSGSDFHKKNIQVFPQ